MIGFNPINSPQFRLALAIQFQENPSAALSTLDQISSLGMDGKDGFGGGVSGFSPWSCGCPSPGYVPSPQINLSGAPAGQGLQTNPANWPAGTVQTAGGYHVVPRGGTTWDVYSPGKSSSDPPETHVWGDPHVENKGGHHFDFSKNSDFVLGDGTRIAATTSSQTGHSVTTGLDITNGADHVSITGVNGSPKTGDVQHDGYEWREQHLAQNPGIDTFQMGGDADHVKWFKENGGKVEGEVTGASYDGSYEQQVDANSKYVVDPSLQPPVGSAAWGNQIRDQLLDQVSQMQIPDFYKQHFADLTKWDAFDGEARANLGFDPFGGLANRFAGWDEACLSLGNMGDIIVAQALAQSQTNAFRSSVNWG